MISESSPTQTITTTTTTVTVVEPLANAARPPRAPPKSASVGSHPQPKTQPEPLRSQRPKAMSWEVPFRDPPAGRRAEPSPTTRKPLFQRNPPSEPPHSPEPEPSEPPTIRKPTNERAGRSASASAAHIRRDRTSSRAEIPEEPSQRAGLLHLVRDFLKDPLVECLDLEVLNMRLEEDEEYGFEAESSDLYGLDESMGCLSPG